MMTDSQALKIEIVSGLDSLSPDELQQVHEFIAFLRWQTQQREASPDNVVKLGSLSEGYPIAEEEIPAASRVGWKEWDQRFDQ